MTKIEFLNRLEELLEDLPTDEREAAIRYYDDYFEDAGIENIDAVISELGSPEKIAANIKSDLNHTWKDSEKEAFTETGYQDGNIKADKYEVADSKTKAGKRNMNLSKILLIVILCIVAIPAGIPILSSVMGIIISLLAGIGGILVALIVATGAFLIGGIILFIAGIIQLFFAPLNGILSCGIGFIILGLGILATLLVILIFTKLIPYIVRKVSNLWKKNQ